MKRYAEFIDKFGLGLVVFGILLGIYSVLCMAGVNIFGNIGEYYPYDENSNDELIPFAQVVVALVSFGLGMHMRDYAFEKQYEDD